MRAKKYLFLLGVILCALQSPALARNDISTQSLTDALGGEADASVDGVKFYFGRSHSRKKDQLQDIEASAHGRVGIDAIATAQGCHTAFKSALSALAKRAKKVASNAVVDVVSIHGDLTLKSRTEYYCGIGRVKTLVQLKGTIIEIKK